MRMMHSQENPEFSWNDIDTRNLWILPHIAIRNSGTSRWIALVVVTDPRIDMWNVVGSWWVPGLKSRACGGRVALFCHMHAPVIVFSKLILLMIALHASIITICVQDKPWIHCGKFAENSLLQIERHTISTNLIKTFRNFDAQHFLYHICTCIQLTICALRPSLSNCVRSRTVPRQTDKPEQHIKVRNAGDQLTIHERKLAKLFAHQKSGWIMTFTSY